MSTPERLREHLTSVPELPADRPIGQDSPQNPTHWMDVLPEREIYDAYAATIAERFPAFSIREFDDARYDMAQSLHLHDDGRPIDQTLVDLIVTPTSHDRFTEDLERFVFKHGLRGWIDSGESLLFVTDHGQFTDVPVVAETLARIGLGHRASTVQVVSEMISLLELDLGLGPFTVIDRLRNVSAVVQTVPRLDTAPSEPLAHYRDRKNDTALTVLRAARDSPGTATVASLVARHNITSKNGNTLYIHEPNRRTLEAYHSPNVKVVPLYVDCPTFGDDGSFAPAELRVELFRPIEISDPRRDTRRVVESFRDATLRNVGERYPGGVKIRSWRVQMASRRVRSPLASGGRD